MSGTLYVVATPIGNLEDITLRALRILKAVSVIAAEDTRRTARLLQRHGITTPTTSFHEHNTRTRVPELLSRLAEGQAIALVSDAGTPGISDPGLELVQACIAAKVPVDPIPGASAPLAALVASGFPVLPVTILGFPPVKANNRNAWLSTLAEIPHTAVFFEAPHRICSTLRTVDHRLGNRPLAIGRELTKAHQEILHGTAAELAERLNTPRGEFTVVVGPRLEPTGKVDDTFDEKSLNSEFRHLTETGDLTRRQAIAELSRKYGRSSREIYATLEHAKRALP